MRFLSSILLLSTVILFLSACSPEVLIDVDCENFYESHHLAKDIKVAVGDEFTMSLCSNPTTGFQWPEKADISDQGVVEQVDHVFLAPSEKDQPPPLGTPGKELWTFIALKQGESTISIEYSQPWEGGEKATWTFVLKVVVE